MKKKALLTATLLLFATGLSTAVVGGPNASEGEMVIMDSGSSSASGTISVGPNGTEYSTYFSVTGTNQTNDTGVLNSSFKNDTVSFTGAVQTPTPCYQISHNVEKDGEQYIFQVKMEEESGTCTQVIAYHSYEANFTAGEPYQLTVKHGNDTVDTLTHPDYTEESNGDNSDEDTGGVRGPIASFFNFLGNLF